MKNVPYKSKIDHPREKLLKKGAVSLTDIELLRNILLSIGINEREILNIANRLLKILDTSNGKPTIEQLQKIKGIGLARAASLISFLELGRRRIRPEGFKVTFPSDVVPLLSHYLDRKQEYFFCISLNGANEIIERRIVTIGLINRTLIHPREIFADPIMDRATSIIVAHNHPSRNLYPSISDIEITKNIKASGDMLGIKLLDHIIFNLKGYFSFLDKGLL